MELRRLFCKTFIDKIPNCIKDIKECRSKEDSYSLTITNPLEDVVVYDFEFSSFSSIMKNRMKKEIEKMLSYHALVRGEVELKSMHFMGMCLEIKVSVERFDRYDKDRYMGNEIFKFKYHMR